jgi:hypothetical protein
MRCRPLFTCLLPILAVLLGFTAQARADLLRNGSFEDVPGSLLGQALLPSEWRAVVMNTDTYSNDGSYGLLPSDFGNFSGQLAQDGLRFIAAASFGAGSSASFGQTLASALIPGQRYLLTAQLLQATRAVLNRAGGYDVFLAPAAAGTFPGSARLLGRLGPTTAAAGWEATTLDFVAPADAAGLPLLVFQAYTSRVNDFAYPGLDAVTLSAVPLPPAVALLPAGLAALLGRRRRSPTQPRN